MKRIFFDMDGCLAEWDPTGEDMLYDEGYFRKLRANFNLVKTAKILIARGEDVYVLSHYLTDSDYAYDEKMDWIEEHLPEIPYSNRLLVPITASKATYAVCTEEDALIDDLGANLAEWHGKRILMYNPYLPDAGYPVKADLKINRDTLPEVLANYLGRGGEL
jgi:5'(3')-deoxyribonucleotidase